MPSDLIIVILVASGISAALLYWIARSFTKQMEAVAAQDRLLQEQAADITFSTAGDDTVFSSRSTAGHDFLKGDSLAVPHADAAAFAEKARRDGLTVKAFPSSMRE